MLTWLSQNLGTIIIALIVAAVVALILIKFIRDKKKGKSSCGCGCSDCPMSGSCRKK